MPRVVKLRLFFLCQGLIGSDSGFLFIKKKRTCHILLLLLNNSSYLASILCTVACTTRDRQYDVYSTNSICLLLITAAVGVDGNISLEENWNNKHWTKTTGNRQYRMITVTVQFITIGWRSITIEDEKCWLYNVSSKNFSLQNI